MRRVASTDLLGLLTGAVLSGVLVTGVLVTGVLVTGVLVTGVLVYPGTASAEPATRVFLNGVPTPVYFNDGDSFRVLGGEFQGTTARLAGFNTLESYGSVHQWGAWTMKELSNYAKLGTLNARRGVWHCTGDAGHRDGYGRILWECPDLRRSQVEQGLAHAMTVTDQGADADTVAAQQAAIAARRGIWAHGVPEFIVTSLHSSTEGYDKGPYNRLVASIDGHSEPWRHNHAYRECQTACQPTVDPDASKVAAFAASLRADPELAPLLKAYTNEQLQGFVDGFVKEGYIAAPFADESVRWKIEQPLVAALASGALSTSGTLRSCMIYVDFTRRYGNARAECLR